MLLELLTITGLTVPPEETCPTLPFEKSDLAEIHGLVDDFIGEESADSMFEEIIEHKCAELKTFPSDRASVSLVEQIIFEGYAPDSNPSSETIERDILVCRINRTYTDNVLVTLDKRCARDEQVYIKYPGIDGDVRISFGGFPIYEARRFLKYLSSMTGKTVRVETVDPDFFKRIYEIVGTKNDEAQVIRARYKSTCGVHSVTAFRQGSEGADYRLEFAPKSGCR